MIQTDAASSLPTVINYFVCVTTIASVIFYVTAQCLFTVDNVYTMI